MKTLEQHAMSAYEDMVWKLAQTKDAAAELTLDMAAATFATIHAVDKTPKQLGEDIEAIRRRINLQDDIAESESARKAREELLAKRAKVEAELAAVQAEFETKLRALDKDVSSADRRLKNTAEARQHYRKTAPAWLKDRIKEIGKRLLEIKEELHRSPPTKPADPRSNLLMANADDELRERLLASHSRRREQYEIALARYNRRHNAELPAEQAALEQERSTLERALVQLRPRKEGVE